MYLTHGPNFFAYKGLESVPTWSIVLALVLSAVGAVLATINRRR